MHTAFKHVCIKRNGLIKRSTIFPVFCFSWFLVNCADAENDTREYGFDLIYDIHAAKQGLDVGEGDFTFSGDFKRARISVKTKVDDWVTGKMSLDFDAKGGAPEVKDAYIDLELSGKTHFSAGRMKLLGGMDQSLSTTDQYFFDRSLPNSLFGLGRSDALEIVTEMHGLSIGANLFLDEDEEGVPVQGWVTKAVFAMNDKARKTHEGLLGVYGSGVRSREDYLVYGPAENIFSASIDGYKFKQPKSELDGYSTLSYEAGYRFDRWLVQGQYFVRKQSEMTADDSRSHGYYWLINRSFGSFKRRLEETSFKPDPAKSIGSELSLRHSVSTMNGDDFYGRAEVVSIALNFYAGKHSKASIQYEIGDMMKRSNDTVKESDHSQALSLRFQYTY